MMRLRIADRAQEDLLDAWLFIAQDSVRAADRLLHRLEVEFGRLLRFPKIGRERLELGNGIRRLVVESHVVFYRKQPDAIEIVRVIHGSRDLPTQFQEE